MVDDGEYELLPHEELEHLRNELHKIKRNPLQGYKQADDLKSSIDALNTSIANLITLFSSTNDELVDAFKKTTIEEHFAQISSQNEQIAQGILAVAKLVEESRTREPDLQQTQQVQQESVSQMPQQAMTSSSSIPPSMEPPMPAGQSQPSPAQAPFPNDLPPLDDPMSMPTNDPFSDPHPLNSQNLASQPPAPSDVGLGGLDLPPPPEKKKGVLGMFK